MQVEFNQLSISKKYKRAFQKNGSFYFIFFTFPPSFVLQVLKPKLLEYNLHIKRKKKRAI